MKVRNPLRLASALAIATALGITISASSGAATLHHEHGFGSQSALFVETDATSGNSILTYQRASDGTISFVNRYQTGGNGGTAAGATADPLASQDGLALANNGSDLIAVNAGSNTISVFAVNGTQLQLRQQIPSGGEFPDSIATSGNFVSVLNAGGAGSVAEFSWRGDQLVPVSGQDRSLNLPPYTPTPGNNPPDFHHGAGQVSYTPNGRFLIVTTKLSTNAYDVFSVGSNGTLSATPTVTTSVNPLPFSFVFDAKGNVVATEAGASAVTTYKVNNNGSLTSLGTVGDGQSALCWISGANGYFFGSNAGSGNVSVFSENSSGAPVLLSSTPTPAHAGTTDSVVSPDGHFLYVESGGAGTIDAFAIGTGGALTPIETLFNIPVASEGLAIS
ncbi:MAG: beta-propeller fold lactonase family protein [Acidimicrobiales bacterium]